MDASGAWRTTFWAAVIIGTLCAIVVAYRMIALSLVLGSPQGNWVYVYLQGFQPRFLRVFLRAWLACGLLIAVLPRFARRSEWLAVAACLVVGTYAQATIRQETRYTVEQIFVSDGANSFYTPTLTHSTGSLLRDFDRLRTELPTHAQSNMPGKLLFISAIGRLSRRPVVLAWLVVLLSNAGGIVLYLFVRDLFADRAVARAALIFYLIVPAKLFFFPVLNTVTPVVVLVCAWLWLRSLRTGRIVYAASFGVAGYGLVFFDPLALVMGLLFAAVAVHELRRVERPWLRFGVLSGAAAVGFVSAYVVLRAGFHFDLIRTFRAVASDASAFNVAARRPYAIWVRQNLFDFFFGLGVCSAVLTCAATGWALLRVRESRWSDPAVVYCLACTGVLVVTDLVGVNRGEVIRLWIFLACFLQVVAANACASLHSRAVLILVAGTMLLQDVFGTGMLNFAQP